MLPARFELHRPTSIAEALALAADHADDATFYAGGTELLPVAPLEQLDHGRRFQRVLLGCGGRTPALVAATPLVRRLHVEGHFVLFGLPAGALETTFERLAARGMHLRGSGFAGGLAYLSGSIEHPDTFRS